MKKTEKFTIYAIFMIVYAALIGYNWANQSQWLFDNVLSIAFLTFFTSITAWLKVKRPGYLMFNIALMIHNLGSFGFYELQYGMFAYDNLVHFVGALVTGYIIFNFVSRKLHMNKNKKQKETIIDEHKLIFIFLVIASVSMLGVMVELVEFSGFMFLGQGDGILFVGSGDSAVPGDLAGQYIDTMGDIIVNIIGTIAGVLIYYYSVYKKKPWLRQ